MAASGTNAANTAKSVQTLAGFSVEDSSAEEQNEGANSLSSSAGAENADQANDGEGQVVAYHSDKSKEQANGTSGEEAPVSAPSNLRLTGSGTDGGRHSLLQQKEKAEGMVA